MYIYMSLKVTVRVTVTHATGHKVLTWTVDLIGVIS